MNKQAFAISIRSYTYKILRACMPALVRKLMVQKEEDLSLDPQNIWETIVGACDYNLTSGEVVGDIFWRSLVGYSS